MKSKTKVLIAITVVVTGLAISAKQVVAELKVAASAYLYGYPLVIMEETRKGMVALDKSNQLKHTQEFPDSHFRLVVRPNVDTLYTTAWLDLTKGPQIVSMPETGDRYYVLPFMDAWTNVFERRGTSTTGNGKQEIAVVGPDFTGELPAGIDSVVKAPTNMVWMIGRIQTNGNADIAKVADIQSKMMLTPLNKWQAGERYQGLTRSLTTNQSIDPMKIVDDMDAQTFFSKMNTLMAKQAPAEVDHQELAKFSYLNIAPATNFSTGNLGFIQQWAVEKALPLTVEKIQQAVGAREANEQGWNVMLDLGSYGKNYKLRTVIARFGLGALPAKEASYPSTSVDADGQAYDGSNNYILHFDADKLPPVEAFWSLSMYDEEGYFIDNKIDRYAIGDRSALQYNQDGSLDLYIQHQQPKQGSSNWLPAPAGKFNLLLRLYMVKQAFLEQQWTVPGVKKVAAN